MQYKKTTVEKEIIEYIESEDGRYSRLVGGTEDSEAFKDARAKVAEYEESVKSAVWQRLVTSGRIVALKPDKEQLADYCMIYRIYSNLCDGIDDYRLYMFKPKTGSDITDLYTYFKLVHFDALDPESSAYGLKDRGGYTWADITMNSYKLEEGKAYLMLENYDGDWFRIIDLGTWVSRVSALVEWLRDK